MGEGGSILPLAALPPLQGLTAAGLAAGGVALFLWNNFVVYCLFIYKGNISMCGFTLCVNMKTLLSLDYLNQSSF